MLSPENIKELQEKYNKYYSADEAERFAFYIGKMNDAARQRQMPRREFDDMTYEQDYMSNKDAAITYRKKKNNDDEVRVASGTTEKKVDVIINELLSSDFDTELHAFDRDDNYLENLGKDFSDIIKRTKEIENDDDKKIDVLQELLSQRALFVQELFSHKTVVDKKRLNILEVVDGKPVNFKKEKRVVTMCEKRIVSGLQVYLGNIHLPAYRFQEQPFIVFVEKMSYEDAKLIYGQWKNWKYVKAGQLNQTWFEGCFDYRFSSNIETDEVEIAHYMNHPDDEYQIIINGVMMLDINTPLPWEKDGYNIEMIIVKPLQRNFAYGASIVASAKTLASISDETIRLFIRKFRQSVEPPIGVKTKKVLSRDMWNAGKISYGITSQNYTKLIDHSGVSVADFNYLNFIEDKVKEFIGQSDASQGLGEKGNPTATEINYLQQQALKNLGLAVYAFISYTKKSDFLRLFNILENYTSPIDKGYDELREKIVDIYQRFTLNDAEVGNKRGQKIMKFIDRDLTDLEQEGVYQYEKEQEAIGKPIKVRYINVKKLRSVKIIWFMSVNQKFRENSALNKAMFTDKLNQALSVSQVTGIPLNGNKIVEDFERLWEAKDFFNKQANNVLMETGGGEGNQGIANEMLSKIEKLGTEMPVPGEQATQKPTINTMEKQNV